MEKSTVERITALRFDIIDTFHLVIFRFLVFRFETLSVRTLSPGRIDIRARMRGFELRPLLSRDYRRKRGTTESISLTQTFRDRRRRRRRRRQSVAHPTPPSTPHSPPPLSKDVLRCVRIRIRVRTTERLIARFHVEPASKRFSKPYPRSLYRSASKRSFSMGTTRN